MTAQLWNHQLEAFPNRKPRQKGPHETCHSIVLSCTNVFELEGFPSYTTHESPGHSRLPLAKFLDLFDLSSLFFSLILLLHLFYKHTIESPLCVGAGGSTENLTWTHEFTFSCSHLALDLIAPAFNIGEAPQTGFSRWELLLRWI